MNTIKHHLFRFIASNIQYWNEIRETQNKNPHNVKHINFWTFLTCFFFDPRSLIIASIHSFDIFTVTYWSGPEFVKIFLIICAVFIHSMMTWTMFSSITEKSTSGDTSSFNWYYNTDLITFLESKHIILLSSASRKTLRHFARDVTTSFSVTDSNRSDVNVECDWVVHLTFTTYWSDLHVRQTLKYD